jgi:acyl carrier protein
MIALDRALMSDLGSDSLHHTELLLEMEEEFGVSIPDEVAETIETVADAVRYIATHRRSA